MVKLGMMIADRYEVIEKIGTGGMSDVYRANDHKLVRNVAVKVLKQEFSENADFVSKFRMEAQAAAGLMHPNIVNVYDVGEESGFQYIVMELVEGITLKKYIEKKARLSVKEAVSIAIQVAMGIEAAHNNHIIHRDIKPQNIIISKEGKVKVTDFGIAKAATSNTITSNVMGSVHYTSPEQVRGGFSDEKSDIYSLGITLFEMLTGRVPFNGETTVAVAIKHIQEEMPSPRIYVPEIPISVEQIVLKCTQKSADRRYQSAPELVEDLKKSLISPDENFVKIDTQEPGGATKNITQKEMEVIKRQSRQTIDEKLMQTGGMQGGTDRILPVKEKEEAEKKTRQKYQDASYSDEGYADDYDQNGYGQNGYIQNDYIQEGYTDGQGYEEYPQGETYLEQVYDEDGNPLYDEDGNPIYEEVYYEAGYTDNPNADDYIPYKPEKTGKSSGTGKKTGKKTNSEKSGSRKSSGDGSSRNGSDRNSSGKSGSGKNGTGKSSAKNTDSKNKTSQKNGSSKANGSHSSGGKSGNRNNPEEREPRRRDVEDDYDPKMELLTTILIVVAAVVIGGIFLVIIARAIGINLGGSSKDNDTVIESSEEVAMINVAGLDVNDAISQLQGIGLVAETIYEESTTIAENVVISASINEGVDVAKGSTVTLTVSSGTSGVAIPMVVGKSQAEAAAALRAEGFEVQVTKAASEDVAKDCVISQNPSSGTAPIGTTIEIIVSSGIETFDVEVPDLRGLSEDDAIVTLTEAGLTGEMEQEEYSDTVEEGLICYQSPQAGMTIKSDTVIEYRISKGQEPAYYNCSTQVNAPADYAGGDAGVVLYGSDGSTLFSTVTQTFPVTVTVNNIWMLSSGNIYITYYTNQSQEVTDAEGNVTVQNVQVQKNSDPIPVTFTKVQQ